MGETLYSMSSRDPKYGYCQVYVGQDRERAMVKIRDKIEAHGDIVPPGVAGWLVKPVEIDDVPIVTLTLSSPELDAAELRRIAEEAEARLSSVRDIFRTEIHGGYRREIRIEIDQDKMWPLASASLTCTSFGRQTIFVSRRGQ
jgi:multidrug efflux pump subunit AcrB